MEITKFGLKNFRVFKEHYDFDLVPIMVLTGPNSSGKSSLTKALLLMKENEFEINKELHIETKINYIQGDHDLGKHKLTLNSKEETTTFSFTFFKNYKYQIEIDDNGKFLCDYNITNENNELVISQFFDRITVDIPNIINYFGERAKAIVIGEYPDIISKIEEINIQKIIHILGKLLQFGQKYWKIDVSINDGRNTDEKIAEDLKLGVLTSLEDIDDSIGLIDEDDFLKQLIMLFKIITSVELTKDEINFLVPPSATFNSNSDFFQFTKLIYVNTLKEPLKRAYSKNDISAFKSFISNEIERERNHVDPQNKFYIDTKKEYRDDSSKKGIFHGFIRKWLNEFGIGETLKFGYNEKKDFYFIKIDNRSLPDYGFGFSSILHILLALSNEAIEQNEKFIQNNENENFKLTFPPTYIIEEPETGLHPAFQSKMAEMLVDIQKTFNVNLIVETHSEYLIRKLQYLTATEKLNPGDAAIYYFNNPKKIPDREEQIKKITIEKNGSLTDNFGPGFIDEGTNLKFELLRLNKNQNN